jgi:thiol:disulfide interchange protein DsbD
MPRLRQLVFLFAALFSIATALAEIPTVGAGVPGPVKAPHLSVELVSGELAAVPGGPIYAGLYFRLENGWHVYWVNAGDSGEPPSIKWQLPAGVTADAMQFPAPQRLPLGPLMDFGYENEVLFPVTLHIAPTVPVGRQLDFTAEVSWLVCREVCIPGRAHLGMILGTVAKKSVDNPLTRDIFRRLAVLPTQLPPNARVTINTTADGFAITLLDGQHEKNAEFYPLDSGQIANAAPQPVQPLLRGIRIRLKKDDTLMKNPAELRGVIKLTDGTAYVIEAPVGGPLPVATYAAQPTIFAAIGLAFLGGIILNLMPCVFPVLFLKGLSLLHGSQEEHRHQRAHGLVYTLGILVSFWAIVAVLLVLRAGGSQFGWGFQLQSPTFIAVLASFLFFFALSMAGFFDIGLSLTSAGGTLAQKKGYAGSFFTGVLATVVATPCTAPFMGAAIGFALSQSAVVTLAIFTALALGLALPYLALTLHPAWTRLLPRPGAWMETLKQLTSVPLFATAIWLVWVYGRLFSGGTAGVDATFRLLLGFLVLAIAGWLLHRWPGRFFSAAIAVLIAALALAIPLTHSKDTMLQWQPYSTQALQQARATGRPVFVDFTAAWCLSCQVNERLVLNSPEVQQRLRDGDVQLLRADWTQYDAQITQELTALGRSGVPTYVIFPPGVQSQPDVLPEALTRGIVLAALDKALAAQQVTP